jgi:ABC-2 type transport system permease protein
VRAVTEWLPFRAMAHLPVLIYLGKAEPAGLARALALQLAWLAVLAAAGRVVLSRMVRRLTLYGG